MLIISTNFFIVKNIKHYGCSDPRIIAWKKIEEEAKLKAKLEKQR